MGWKGKGSWGEGERGGIGGVVRMVRNGHAHLRLFGRGWSFLMRDISIYHLDINIRVSNTIEISK